MHAVIKKLLTLGLAFAMVPLQAVFYGAHVWESKKKNQRIILFSDIHVPCEDSAVAQQQQDAVVDYAKKHNAHVVVEDSGDITLLNKKIFSESFITLCENYPKIFSPLDVMTKKAKLQKVKCTNVEFRTTRTVIEELMKECSKKEMIRAEINTQFALNDYLEAHLTIIREIEGYKDAEVLMKEYKNIVKNFKHQVHSVNILNAVIIEEADAGLLDARLLHTIHNSKASQIIICAGGWHIDNVIETLPKLGFSEVKKEIHSFDFEQFEGSEKKFPSKLTINVSKFLSQIDAQKRSLARWIPYAALGAGLCAIGYYFYKWYKSTTT